MRLHKVALTRLPTDAGTFAVHAFVDRTTGTEYLALVMGDLGRPDDVPPLVRVHSECLTGDALGSTRCDCGDQLQAAQRAVAAEGRGAILYLRGHEGRGIGLSAKLQAYGLQDSGLDTVDANLALGLAVDTRDYRPAAALLRRLGVRRVRLLTGNPDKHAALTRHGIDVVEQITLPVPARPENLHYLRTKRERMGHVEPVHRPDAWDELLAGRVPAGPLSPGAAALVDRYAPLVAAGAEVAVAQLGQSLDGFIASRTGDAVFVTGEADREHLHRLRALVDAVVVGVGTVVADDPQLTVRAVPGRSPVRVVLDPRARLPRSSRLLRADRDGVPVLWCVAEDVEAPTGPPLHVEVLALKCGDDGFAPADVLTALADRGLGRVLVEGGGRTVSGFLAAGVLDRLYVTTAPLLVGDGVPGIRFDGTDLLAGALRPPSRSFVLGGDVCVELDLAAARAARVGEQERDTR